MQTHLQCFHKEELSVTCDAQCFGSDQRCAGGSLRTVAVVAVLIYGGFVPLMYFFLLLESRRAIQSQRPTALSRALTFLYAEYRTGLFFCKSTLRASPCRPPPHAPGCARYLGHRTTIPRHARIGTWPVVHVS